MEAIALILIRALGGFGKDQLEKGLVWLDNVVCNSPTEVDNELWLNIVLPAVKDHQSVCPPPES